MTVLSILLSLSALGSAGFFFFTLHGMKTHGRPVQPSPTASGPETAAPSAFVGGFEGFLRDALAVHDVAGKDIRRLGTGSGGSGEPAVYAVNIPASELFTLVLLSLSEEAEKRGANVLDAVEGADGAELAVRFAAGTVPAGTALLRKSPGKRRRAPVAAVVVAVAESGVDTAGLGALCRLEPTVTLAAAPGREHTAAAVKIADETGAGLMVYLAAEEGRSGDGDSDGAILPTDPAETIRRKLARAFEGVSGASGLMTGADFPAGGDVRVLETIMDELRAAGRFHLDSRRRGRSPGCAAAERRWVKTGSIGGFIDDVPGAATAGLRMRELVEAADDGGVVIAGSARREVVDGFLKEIPALRERGVRFVRVSDLVR